MGVFLMYHELARPGRPLCDSSPGYVRYVVGEEDFVRQLDRLRALGLAGLTVSDALQRAQGAVAITFDDGCETDLLIAAPALSARGFGATFYVTTGFLNRAGYLGTTQLRSLAESGFEIGSHGVTHRFLSDLADADLVSELSDSKACLEDIVGRAVEHFSCPGGRWDSRVAGTAHEVGYSSVATSRTGTVSSGTHRFNLRRNAVMRHTSLHEFDRLCRGRASVLSHCRSAALSVAKSTLGNRAYERLRDTVLTRF